MKMLLLASLAATAVVAVSSAETVNFDNMNAGAPPPGWTGTQTGSGTAKWAVEKDESAPTTPNVLKQSGDFLDRQGEFEKEVGGYFRAGKVKNKETVVEGIEQAAGAFIGLFEGKNVGKMVVKLA